MLKGATSTPNITPVAAQPQQGRCMAPVLRVFDFASGPLLVLLAVLLVASCLPDSPSGSFFPIWERFLAIWRSKLEVRTFKNIGFTMGKPACP